MPWVGEGHSQTQHRNYLLPISSNIEQDKKDVPMAGVENTSTLTPVPPVDSVPTDAVPSGMVMSSTAGNSPHSSLDQPASLKHGTQTTLTDSHGGTRISVCWQIPVYPASGMHWFGLCICLHVISCLYTVFWGSTV